MNKIKAEAGSFPELVGTIRRQLDLSQEGLARQLGVCFATVNRWEKGHNIPSKSALAGLNAFCRKMIERGKLVLPDEPHP
jgi:DNA-binding transcriptional regulator YiaG